MASLKHLLQHYGMYRDTPGFGDNLNNQEEIDAVKRYILSKHEAWLCLNPLLEEHERLSRDERVHCGTEYY